MYISRPTASTSRDRVSSRMFTGIEEASMTESSGRNQRGKSGHARSRWFMMGSDDGQARPNAGSFQRAPRAQSGGKNSDILASDPVCPRTSENRARTVRECPVGTDDKGPTEVGFREHHSGGPVYTAWLSSIVRPGSAPPSGKLYAPLSGTTRDANCLANRVCEPPTIQLAPRGVFLNVSDCRAGISVPISATTRHCRVSSRLVHTVAINGRRRVEDPCGRVNRLQSVLETRRLRSSSLVTVTTPGWRSSRARDGVPW